MRKNKSMLIVVIATLIVALIVTTFINFKTKITKAQVTNSSIRSDRELYIFILPIHHTWSGNGGKTWDRGAPGSTQSQGYTINMADILKVSPDQIEYAKAEPYNMLNPNWQNWDNNIFRYNATVKMGSDHKNGFDDNYMSKYVSKTNTINGSNYSNQTGLLKFKQVYSLDTEFSGEGLKLHTPLQELGEDGKQEVLNWIGADQPPAVMTKLNQAIGNTNSKLRGYAYFQPYVITFKMKSNEDMAINNKAELLDKNKNKTDKIILGEKHYVRLVVTKPVGNKKVGDPANLGDNPYTTLMVQIGDSFGSEYKAIPATQTLLPNGKVEILAEYTPTTDYVIKGHATISPIHNQKGYDNNLNNNGPVYFEFTNNIDISVSNFNALPNVVDIQDGQPVQRNMTFNFDITNNNQDDRGYDVPYVISRNGQIIKTGTVNVPAKSKITITERATDTLGKGNNVYMVEVNPAPRVIIERVSGVSNPYTNNVATDNVLGRPVQEKKECEVIHTRNDWTIEYYVYQWRGHRESYDCSFKKCSGKSPNKKCHTVHRTCTRCVTDSTWTENPVVSHYETFKIKNVYFKSKLTTDTQGGWVDILNQPGKIKAGYGFELKVVVNYDTNIARSAPKPWTSGCSGMSVSPGYSTVNTPNKMYLKMPYNDDFGNPVRYTLDGSGSGNWDNYNNTYQLPTRSAFGIKDVPMIFINEGARDGVYELQLDTSSFYGSTDKPQTDVNLCDRKTVKIQIKGGGTDDLKTHIIQ